MTSPTRTAAMRTLRIIVVHNLVRAADEDDAALRAQAARAHALHLGLVEAGYDIVASLPADMHLPEQIAKLQPDMIIVDAESDARDVLEHIVIATRDERRPIVSSPRARTPAAWRRPWRPVCRPISSPACTPSASSRCSTWRWRASGKTRNCAANSPTPNSNLPNARWSSAPRAC